HAAGAARFKRPAWVVEPNIHALDQVASDVDVVILDEYDAAAKFGTPANLDDLGDQLLAAVVARMGLAGEDDLHRAVLVVDDGGQALQVAKEQVAALVGGEAAGKADGQGFGIEHFVGAGDFGGGRAATLQLGLEMATGEHHEAFAATFMGAPQFGIGNAL